MQFDLANLAKQKIRRNDRQLSIQIRLNWNSIRVPTRVCINSSRPNWFIIHMKRSDTCSHFPAIRYQICSYLLIELNAARRHVSPVPA